MGALGRPSQLAQWKSRTKAGRQRLEFKRAQPSSQAVEWLRLSVTLPSKTYSVADVQIQQTEK